MKTQQKKTAIEQLRKMPVVEIACSKAGISRATFYRWKQADEKFAREAEEAMSDGTHMINDLAESQLISAIREKNFAAISLWLRTHHPSYANKLEVSGLISHEVGKLTPEQQALYDKAIARANFPLLEESNQNNESEETK